jgi:hypothetical protein
VDPLLLVGTWDFSRQIDDHRDGAEYAASGRAELAPEGDGRIRWAEHGTLRWSAGTTPVSRTLFLVRDGDTAGSPSGWRVTFEDGRDFHPWTAGAVEHLCGRDLYRGGVEVPHELSRSPEQDRSWELTWRVRGPEKDYTMRTVYSRFPQA